MGWDNVLSKKQIHLVPVDGTRVTMLSEQHDASAGRALDVALSAACREPQRLNEFVYRPQLTIQAGSRIHDPVFCVPGAGDTVTGFVPLANALGSEWPIHGLQPRGIDGLLVQHSKVETAASSYLRAIRAIASGRSVHLVGHSFGGWVAFEMASQMYAAGLPIASLTLIDSEPPDEMDSSAPEYTATAVLVEFIEILELSAAQSLNIDLARFKVQSHAEQLRQLHQGMVRVGLMPKRSEPKALQGSIRTFASALRAHYTPKTKYPFPVRLVLARDTRVDEETNRRLHDDTLRGWTRHAADITAWRSAGDHFSVLKPPHVQALAQWWREGLPSQVMALVARAPGEVSL